MTEQRAILIAGPTASGKSRLALCLAEKLDGVIINADSMQVYRDLRVLTARPSADDEARAPHRLYGFVDGGGTYSAGRYADDVRAALDAVRLAGKRAIVVGGTGLYFRVLTDGLSPVPPIPEEVRTAWRARGGADGGGEAVYRELAARDPVMAARLEPGDRQRVLRALEVFEATGRSLAEWQAEPGVPILGEDATVRLWIELERAELYARCEKRFDEMMGRGALDEVRQLLEQGLDTELPVMRALGVQELRLVLSGDISLDEAVARAKLSTRHYVKRQLTWARRNMISWKSLKLKSMERILDGDVTLIDRGASSV